MLDLKTIDKINRGKLKEFTFVLKDKRALMSRGSGSKPTIVPSVSWVANGGSALVQIRILCCT